jgi:hypothetical protein
MVHGHEMMIMVEMHMKWWSWWSSMRRWTWNKVIKAKV